MHLVPAHGIPATDGGALPLTAAQVVGEALRYFAGHFQDPIVIPDLAQALSVSHGCLDDSFDHVRGMTPAQALQDFRLNKLFSSLTDAPHQGLSHAVHACGLGPTPGVLALFEQTFGIAMPLFLLTCRRAYDDRQFRSTHPGADALVIQQSAEP